MYLQTHDASATGTAGAPIHEKIAAGRNAPATVWPRAPSPALGADMRASPARTTMGTPRTAPLPTSAALAGPSPMAGDAGAAPAGRASAPAPATGAGAAPAGTAGVTTATTAAGTVGASTVNAGGGAAPAGRASAPPPATGAGAATADHLRAERRFRSTQVVFLFLVSQCLVSFVLLLRPPRPRLVP